MKYLIIILMLNTAFTSAAKNNRTITHMIVDDYFEKSINLAALAPQDYWILIVLDGNIMSSQQMLTQLQNYKADLSATIILLINSQSSKESFYATYQSSLQPYSWVNTTDKKVLKKLSISATPTTFGLHKGEIIWQNSGLAKKYQQKINLSQQITNWTKKLTKKLTENLTENLTKEQP